MSARRWFLYLVSRRLLGVGGDTHVAWGLATVLSGNQCVAFENSHLPHGREEVRQCRDVHSETPGPKRCDRPCHGHLHLRHTREEAERRVNVPLSKLNEAEECYHSPARSHQCHQ